MGNSSVTTQMSQTSGHSSVVVSGGRLVVVLGGTLGVVVGGSVLVG